MKKIICAEIFLLALFTASAQKTGKNGNFEFTFGASVPVSTFATGETGNHIKGFAKTGGAITLSYYHPTKNKIGLMVMLAGQINPLNTTALEEEYSHIPYFGIGFYSTFPPPPPPPSSPVYYNNWSFEKASWFSTSLLVGAHTFFPLNKDEKLSMTLKAGTGAVYVNSPQYKGVSRTDTSVVRVLQEKNHAFGFSFSIIPGLSYTIQPGINIGFSLNYFGTANMNFNRMETSGSLETTSGGLPGSSFSTWKWTSDVQQSIQAINLLVGIQFEL